MARPIIRPIIRSIVRPIVRDDGPTPAGPLDRLIPSGVNGFSTSYTNAYGNVHFRMAYINGAASVPTISITVDGSPATLIAQDGDAAVGASGAIAFYVTGLAPGAHTIAIAVSAGTVTMAALRVGELVTQTGIGAAEVSVQTNPTYYIEVDAVAIGAPGTSQMGSIYVANSANAFEITTSYPDVEQWSGSQPGMAFRFGTGSSPSGEGGGLFVAYNSAGGSFNNAGIVYEIRGATLP